MKFVILLFSILITSCSGNNNPKKVLDLKTVNILTPDSCISVMKSKLKDLEKNHDFSYELERFDVHLESFQELTRYVRVSVDDIDTKLSIVNTLNKIILGCHPNMSIIINRGSNAWSELESTVQELENLDVGFTNIVFNKEEIIIYVKSSQYKNRYNNNGG